MRVARLHEGSSNNDCNSMLAHLYLNLLTRYLKLKRKIIILIIKRKKIQKRIFVIQLDIR